MNFFRNWILAVSERGGTDSPAAACRAELHARCLVMGALRLHIVRCALTHVVVLAWRMA